jgi:hypothetical protein
MSWLKRKLRRWLNSDNEISISEDRAYSTAGNSMGDLHTTVQMFKAMNGTVLILHTPRMANKNTIGPVSPTMYVLKEGESIQDAVATLLVKARLDSM